MFRLAYDFQHIDPYEMVSDVPNWLINQWKAWYSLHNLVGNTLDPEFRGDVRVAKGFSILANHWRDKQALGIEDLMTFPPPKPPQTPEQLQAALEARVRITEKQQARKAARNLKPNGVIQPEPQDKPRPSHRRPQERRRSREVHAPGDREERRDLQ